MRSSKYNAALLGPIVRSSRTLGEVLRRLARPATGGNYRFIAARLRHEHIDTSHFRTMTMVARCAAVPSETLANLVARSTSVAQVLTELQLPTEGRSHREISRRIRELAIDTSHLRGRSWARGQTKASNASLARASARTRFPDSRVFVENSSIVGGTTASTTTTGSSISGSCPNCHSQTEIYGNRRR